MIFGLGSGAQKSFFEIDVLETCGNTFLLTL